MRVQVLVALETGAGGRLDGAPRTARPPQGLMGHGTLVHRVVGVTQLRGGVACDPAQSGHQGSGGEVGGEVLVGKALHWLHGGDRAGSIGRDGRPGVAADVLQAGDELRALGGAGVHAGLPRRRLTPVGGAGEPQGLGVTDGPIVMVVLAGGTLQVSFLVAVLT